MKEIPTYMKDSYKKHLKTEVVSVDSDDNTVSVVLEDTVFYPEGGGQPCDQGVITSKNFKLKVTGVKLENGEVVHKGTAEGEIGPGDEVVCEIDWNRRYKNMKIHTGGHILDEAMSRLGFVPEVMEPAKASHGKNAYVVYTKPEKKLPNDLHKKLEQKITEITENSEEIGTEFVKKEEIPQKTRWAPPNLPSSKPLRIVSIGDELGIPDGGTLLKNTSELREVTIDEIETIEDGMVKISYSVSLEEEKVEKKPKTGSTEKFSEVETVRDDFKSDLESNPSYSDLKPKYLGKNGLVKSLLRKIGDQSPDKRADFGRQVNLLNNEVEKELMKLKKRQTRARRGETLSEDSFDVTAPFAPNTSEEDRPELISRPGTLHPITSIGEEALRIFESMGFHVTESRRLDSDYNVFEALNLPIGHPARDMWDTFWTEDDLIPITHTSAMQNRILKNQDTPIREVVFGRCFRHEATDASHEHSFFQIEGLYVDKGITLGDLIGTLSEFMNTFYGKEIKYRIQPSFFPFVEPGLEFMVECLVCGQKGCSFCGRSGWIELVPCGPVHRNVLKYGGLDPDEYSGFAWGLGLDRLVMLRDQIEDIRHLQAGDLRFLEQFS